MMGQHWPISGLILPLMILLFLLSTHATANAQDNCYSGPAPVIVNRDADIYLGIVGKPLPFLSFSLSLCLTPQSSSVARSRLSFQLHSTTGVLLNVREMDDDTPGKCGTALHREAIELYEALRWYLSFINQKSGQVAARLVKDSLIPGMKLG